MPALGTPNADSGALAHLVGFGPLDEKVHAFSGPADVLPGRVVPRVKPPVLVGKFADPQETKEAEGKGRSEHPTVVSFQGGLPPTSTACDPASPQSAAVVWA